MIEKSPLTFVPYLKSVIWGGNKICAFKGIPQPEPNIGESWEISAIPGHESVVAEGSYRGLTITDLIGRFGDALLGERVMRRYDGKFPLLIKLIDAADNLSVQVHPDDVLAKARHNSLGKTEMWYIIQSDRDARIYSGLTEEISPCEYVARVADDTFADLLAVHDSHPGDVFFLPAGRVHAIGAGNLLAEIQESSDITYRIYDYNRTDAEGRPRMLHTMQAKDAIDFTVTDYTTPSPPPDAADFTVVSCRHFVTRRILLDGEMDIPLASGSFTVLVCTEGECRLTYPAGEVSLRAGHSVLLPAAMEEISAKGNAVMLSTHIPDPDCQ